MKLEEPYDGRLSRTVLWERSGEIPLRDPIVCNARNPFLKLNLFTKKETSIFAIN